MRLPRNVLMVCNNIKKGHKVSSKKVSMTPKRAITMSWDRAFEEREKEELQELPKSSCQLEGTRQVYAVKELRNSEIVRTERSLGLWNICSVLITEALCYQWRSSKNLKSRSQKALEADVCQEARMITPLGNHPGLPLFLWWGKNNKMIQQNIPASMNFSTLWVTN